MTKIKKKVTRNTGVDVYEGDHSLTAARFQTVQSVCNEFSTYFLRKHEIDLSNHPAMQFLGIRTKDCVSRYRDICFSLFGACSIHNNQEMEKGVLC